MYKLSSITKKHITKKSRNSKLKEKYYINEKTHLAAEKKFVLHHSLRINKRGFLISSGLEEGRGSEKNQKINNRPPPFPLPFIRHLRVKVLMLSVQGFSFCGFNSQTLKVKLLFSM